MGELISKLGEYISSITSREYNFLFLGIIIGAIIMYVIKSSYRLRLILSKPAETILVASVTVIVFLQIFNSKLISSMSDLILNFLSTMAFSWIITKYSVKNDYENKQKEVSSLSYKHSTVIKNKLELTLSDLNKYINESFQCSSGESCELKMKLENIKSQISYSYQDSIDNQNDWAVNISEELALYEDIVKLERKIEEKEDELNFKTTNGENINNIKYDIKKLEKEKKNIENSINPKVLHLIKVSKEENKLSEESLIRNRMSSGLSKRLKNKMVAE